MHVCVMLSLVIHGSVPTAVKQSVKAHGPLVYAAFVLSLINLSLHLLPVCAVLL